MKKLPMRGLLGSPLVRSSLPSRELLLYVEDDDDNYSVAELRLGERYELCRADSARRAAHLLMSRGPQISAVLMDIELRGSELNGVELTMAMRGKYVARADSPEYVRRIPQLGTPVIFVTAHGAKYSDAQLIMAGGDRVLQKPVDFAALSLALTQLHLANLMKRRHV